MFKIANFTKLNPSNIIILTCFRGYFTPITLWNAEGYHVSKGRQDKDSLKICKYI